MANRPRFSIDEVAASLARMRDIRHSIRDIQMTFFEIHQRGMDALHRRDFTTFADVIVDEYRLIRTQGALIRQQQQQQLSLIGLSVSTKVATKKKSSAPER